MEIVMKSSNVRQVRARARKRIATMVTPMVRNVFQSKSADGVQLDFVIDF
jgi:hypothetical protein